VPETRQDQEKQFGPARYWLREIDQSTDHERDWRERADRVVERYRDERGVGAASNLEKKFNILWSNTETLKGSLFAQMAKPDVRRRYADGNVDGRQVAIVLERALNYELDLYDADRVILAALEDYLLPGRGVCWIVYEPVIVTETTKIEIDSDELDLTEETTERLGDQRTRIEYVHWQDYRESPSRRSDDVTWRARRHLLTRDELVGRGFDKPYDIPLSWSPSESDESYPDQDELYARAEVWEIWDKVTRKRIYVATGHDKLLAEDEDPYSLENFFPCPSPLIAVKTNNTNIPIPEFTEYQDQADELDRITTRISYLIEALKRRGVYDASVPELAQLATAGDNDFVPSENFAYLQQKGGLAGSFQTEDLSPIMVALNGLYQQRTQLLSTIYEVTGISDLLRGTTKASETATAQQLKSQYGSLRLRRRQDEIQKYIRDLFRIKAEIIAENYEADTLQRMTNIQTTPQMLQIMRDDKMRSYVIDVESDSTVFSDEQEEKQTRIQFADTVGNFLVRALEVTRSAPEATPLMFEMLKFVSGAWKVGRTFEDVINQTENETMQQLMQLRSQPPGPTPEQQLAQEKIQAQMAMEQLRQQGKLADIDSRERSNLAKIEAEERGSQARTQSKEDLAMFDAELELRKGN
jgi:hypothetical protein